MHAFALNIADFAEPVHLYEHEAAFKLAAVAATASVSLGDGHGWPEIFSPIY
jgi:hypothetical protein